MQIVVDRVRSCAIVGDMAKHTKTQRDTLGRMLADLDAALAYYMGPDIVLARRKAQSTLTTDYTRADGAVLGEITKDIGSDMARLWSVRQALVRYFDSGL